MARPCFSKPERPPSRSPRGRKRRASRVVTAMALAAASLVARPLSARADDVHWTGLGLDGLWQTADNWDLGLPGPLDDVFNTLAEAIVHSAGDDVIHSFASNGLLTMAGGSITGAALVGNAPVSTFQADAGLTMNGGLLDAFILTVGGAGVVADNNAANRLANVALTGNIDLTATDAFLQVDGFSTIAGTINLGDTGWLRMGGDAQLLSGGITFGAGGPSYVGLLDIAADSTFTIASGVTVSGENGEIGSGGCACANDTLINGGVISAIVAGGSIDIVPANFTNNGTVEALGDANGGAGIYLGVDTTATNNGTFRVDGVDSTFEIDALLTNSATGQILATNGGALGVIFTGVVNDGLINVDGAGSYADFIGSEIENANGSITTTNGGVIYMLGTAITGGTVNGSLVFNWDDNLFTDLAVSGSLDLATAGGLANFFGTSTIDGATIIGDGGDLAASGDLTYRSGSITFDNDQGGYLDVNGGGKLTINAGVTVSGGFAVIGEALDTEPQGERTVVNHGKMSADQSGGLWAFVPTTLTSDGIIEAVNGAIIYVQAETTTNAGTFHVGGGSAFIVDGEMTQTAGQTVVDAGGTFQATGEAGFWMEGGTLSGNGLVVANVMNLGGTVSPGASPGALTISGNYTQLSGAELLIQLAGYGMGLPDGYDWLSVLNGDVFLDGLVRFEFLNGFLPNEGDFFDFLTWDSSHTFTAGSGLHFADNLFGAYTYDVTNTGSSLRLTIGPQATVPEPGVWGMLSGTAAGFGLLLRRKRRA